MAAMGWDPAVSYRRLAKLAVALQLHTGPSCEGR